MEYKATLDLKSKVITGSTAILFTAITIYNVLLISNAQQSSQGSLTLLIISILVISIFLSCYLYRPIRYMVDNEKITVKRSLKDFIIHFSDIKDVILPSKESMRWTIRTFGNGGLFGYFGAFRNSSYGNMIWYATKTENYLMIVTKTNKKLLLTPDDIDMANEIKKRLS